MGCLSTSNTSFSAWKPSSISAYVDINAPLVERCRLNDRQAQAEIYRRYAKAMFNAALRITGDYAEAEDVLQESFLSAFRELSGYKGDSSFGAWLKRIVVNKSINCLRQRRLALVPLGEQHHDEPAEAAAPSPEDEADTALPRRRAAPLHSGAARRLPRGADPVPARRLRPPRNCQHPGHFRVYFQVAVQPGPGPAARAGRPARPELSRLLSLPHASSLR